MRDVRWEQGDLGLGEAVLAVVQVVLHGALVDEQNGPGVVGVAGVGVRRKVRVQHLDNPGQPGSPSPHLRPAAHTIDATVVPTGELEGLQRVKIYISADMEGITGLVDAEDVQPRGRDYERGRLMMTEDVNAAIRGAYAAGAVEVLVNDAHGPMRNLLPELLDPRAALIKGRPKPLGMIEGLTPEYDAVLCVGFHSRAGTLGVLSHSFMGHEIEDIWLDEQPVGEIGLLQAAAQSLGVPVVLLTGDDTACAEMKAWDPEVATVAVKYAKDRFAAQLVPVAEARAQIEATTTAALQTVARSNTPARPAEVAGAAGPAAGVAGGAAGLAGDRGDRLLTVRWQSASVASHLTAIPGVRKRDDRTVEVESSMHDLYRLFCLFLRVATAVTTNPPYC